MPVSDIVSFDNRTEMQLELESEHVFASIAEEVSDACCRVRPVASGHVDERQRARLPADARNPGDVAERAAWPGDEGAWDWEVDDLPAEGGSAGARSRPKAGVGAPRPVATGVLLRERLVCRCSCPGSPRLEVSGPPVQLVAASKTR